MNYKLKNRGFSLTEVLLSVGILAVGMIFVAGVFPVGIHFTTIATERTIAAIVADEAFAKIKIYAIGDPSKNIPGDDDVDLGVLETDELKPDEVTDFNNIFPATDNIDPDEFTYPSDPNIDISRKQYCWSALCRRVGADPSRLVQVTVFVSRKVGSHLKYRTLDDIDDDNWPRPVSVGVSPGDKDNELDIEPGKRSYINDGYTIVDDRTGRIYRVLERYADEPDTILLDRDWDKKDWKGETHDPKVVWVVPPPVNGSRYPCIAIYQKVIRF